MELLQLKYFRTVARYEHMTRAAEELSIAQPSLSQTIKRLEKEVGVRLFDRKGRKIRLNRYGKLFLEKTEQALATLEEGKREVADLAKLNDNCISLSVMRTPIIPDLLSHFHHWHPAVRFRVRQLSLTTVMHQLETGEIDMCITPYQKEPDSPYDWKRLMNDEIYLVVPGSHHLACRSSIDLLDIAREPFILKASGAFREVTDTFFQMAGFEPDIAFEVDDPVSIRCLVREGLGVAFFSSLTLQSIKDCSIVPLKINKPRCFRTISLVWNTERHHSPIAVQFYHYVVQYFSELNQKEKGRPGQLPG
ncbi:LysR family transcriptional regulator [Sporolactobacillus sp. THM7-4]|nr:LysR family transcriptional regulator [Sporolactobacillus sp. THM7-4]